MKKKYNYFSNLGFMLREHWNFDKSYVIMQMVLTPLGALTSVVAAYLPKVVLDCVENKSSVSGMIIKVSLMSAVLILFSYVQGVSQTKTHQGNRLSRDVMLHKLICNKVMSMDYTRGCTCCSSSRCCRSCGCSRSSRRHRLRR